MKDARVLLTIACAVSASLACGEIAGLGDVPRPLADDGGVADSGDAGGDPIVPTLPSGDLIGVVRGERWLVDSNASGTLDGIDKAFVLTADPRLGEGPIPLAAAPPLAVDDACTPIALFGTGFLVSHECGGPFDADGSAPVFDYGHRGDIPLLGRWTSALRHAAVGVFSVTSGQWWLDANGNGGWDGDPTDLLRTFGAFGDIPVMGDWTGNGVTKIGVYRTGQWLLDANGNGKWDGPTSGDMQLSFGSPSDTPVTGDWNDDGKTDIGTFRDGSWQLDVSGDGVWGGSTGGDALLVFGAQGDVPVVGRWRLTK